MNLKSSIPRLSRHLQKQRKNHAAEKINGEISPQQNQQQEMERRKDERKMQKSLDFNTQSVKKEIPHSDSFIA